MAFVKGFNSNPPSMIK